tara:strand:+ start:71 stop:253 length:183 start_codon:yes stop_codon:yes gene_type:complete
MKKTFEGKNLTAYTCDTSEELISAIKDTRRRMIWEALYKPVDNNKKEENNEPTIISNKKN